MAAQCRHPIAREPASSRRRVLFVAPPLAQENRGERVGDSPVTAGIGVETRTEVAGRHGGPADLESALRRAGFTAVEVLTTNRFFVLGWARRR
jgi:hypothetical protein